MENIIKKWWFWTIIIFIILIIVMSVLGLNTSKKDNTNMSSYEVKRYLEDKGYEFETDDYTYIYTTHYIIIKNDKEGIWLQQYQNEIIGTKISFKNSSCNDEFADVSSESANETKLEKDQYKAYLNWLADMGLSKSQIIDVLKYYDENREMNEEEKFINDSIKIKYNELKQVQEYTKVKLTGKIVKSYKTELGSLEYTLNVIENGEFVGLINFSNTSKTIIEENDIIDIYGYTLKKENSEYPFIWGQVINR